MQQSYNPANAGIRIWVGDRLLPREDAKISVFDSAVQGGDAVWEGIRVYDGRIFSLDDHLNRLMESAKTMAFEQIPDIGFIKQAIFETLKANGMRDGAHIRLTLTRGEKITSGMDPRLNTMGCTLIVLAEWKMPVYAVSGIRLVTSAVRRNSPTHLDSKIHHNNLINNILAKIEANFSGADDALMLDQDGFVAETNACNIFMCKNGVLLTPLADACLPGITRKKVLLLAEELHIKAQERRLSLSEFYNADEVFITGTMGELSRVSEIDGRKIENKTASGLFDTLAAAFRKLTQTTGELLPF